MLGALPAWREGAVIPEAGGEVRGHKFQGDHPQSWKATQEQAHLWAILSIWKEAPYPWREGEVSGFPMQSLLGVVSFYHLSLLL